MPALAVRASPLDAGSTPGPRARKVIAYDIGFSDGRYKTRFRSAGSTVSGAESDQRWRYDQGGGNVILVADASYRRRGRGMTLPDTGYPLDVPASRAARCAAAIKCSPRGGGSRTHRFVLDPDGPLGCHPVRAHTIIACCRRRHEHRSEIAGIRPQDRAAGWHAAARRRSSHAAVGGHVRAEDGALTSSGDPIDFRGRRCSTI